MKKHIAASLLLAAMLASMAACGQGSGAPSDTTAQSTNDTTAPAEDNRYSLEKYLPKQDLEGFTYTILAFSQLAIDSIYMDEENGSLIDDAVAKKIRTVEEHLNCDIVLSEQSKSENVEGNNETKTSILSGEYEFDLVFAHDISLANLSLEGMFTNVLDLDAFNFEAEWWPQKTIDSIRVGDTMFLMSNNVSYYPVSDLRAMFFNKELMENYGYSNPYSMVYDGTWTFDKMNEMVATVYKDLNGNTQKDVDDQYGFAHRPQYYAWLEALDISYFTADKDGTISYNFDLDRSSTLVEKVYDLVFTSGGSFIASGAAEYNKMFADGHLLFSYSKMSDAVKTFSFSETLYGVLPMPKLDDTQEDYLGGCTDRPTAIPVTVPVENLEKVALITEAMNIEGYYTVFPVYFETALKTRYADDTEDAKMMQMIFDNRVLSFSYLYGGFSSPAMKILETSLDPANPNKNVASYAASVQNIMDERVAALNEAFSGE